MPESMRFRHLCFMEAAGVDNSTHCQPTRMPSLFPPPKVLYDFAYAAE
jgi:hypothetical protein